MDAHSLPLPAPNVESRPFWDGCRKGKLRIQCCRACGRYRFYPAAGCPHCGSADAVWKDVSGHGVVYSWIVVRRTVDPVWQAMVPYISAIVAIAEDEQTLVPGLLTGIDPVDIRAGLAVEVWFEMVEGAALPRWRPPEST